MMYSTSIWSAIDGVNNDPPDLEGYLGLTDSIVPIILNASLETELESNEDDNDPRSDEESVNNPDTVRANDYNDYSLEKAKKILWRLKQRDLLDLIDEVDSTETKKVLYYY